MIAVSNAQKLQQLFGQASILSFNEVSKQVFSRLHHCHTASNGSHTYRCNEGACHHLHYQYHSCGNRHCPNCGGLKKSNGLKTSPPICCPRVIIMLCSPRR